jgi:hypothetical protein
MNDDEKTTKVMMFALTAGALALAACGGAGGEEGVEDAAEFADAVPSAAMVDLSDDDTTSSAALTARQGLGGPEGTFKDHVSQVRADINGLIARTHDVIDTMKEEGTVTAVTVDGKDCRAWDWDGPRAAYRLLVCREQGQVDGISGQAFGWLIAGRPLGSTDDDEFKAVAAGVGARAEGPNGRRGGVGRVGYDFDNLSSLNGEDYRGKIGIGYFAGKRARKAILGLKDVKKDAAAEAFTALYRFERVIGKGGRFVFLTHHDFMTRSDADQSLELGQDTVKEYGRAAVAWNAQGKARTAFAACGGTVGEGACVAVRQCWDRAGVTYGELAESGEPSWEPSSCGEVDFEVAAPADGELDFGGDTDGVTIPEGDE